MFGSLIRRGRGYLRIRIIGASPERFLNLCRNHGIFLWGLCPDGKTYQMYIQLKDFRRLKPILRKTRTRVVIEARIGLPFFLHKYRRRKVFFAGAVCCAATVYLLSLFIWNIHIDGNQTQSDEVLLEFLEEKSVVHGMRKKEVDCERIVKEIRQQFDDIIWVSAYTRGTRLMIRVKENTDTIPDTAGRTEEDASGSGEKEPAPTDIVSEKSGVVTSIITRRGVPMVHEGDEVKPGDLLVCGRVEVLNDSREVIGYQYQTSDADIILRTSRAYSDSMPRSYLKKLYTGKKKRQFYIRIGGKTLAVGGIRNRYKKSERRTEERQLKIGEHFYLPVFCGKREVLEYRQERRMYPKEKLDAVLNVHFEEFQDDLEKKGVQILENNVKIQIGSDAASAEGTLILLEPAGVSAATERIEIEQQAEREE